PAIRELIAEYSRRLKKENAVSDPILRSRLVKEIQENLPVWVSCELKHLANHLYSLAQSIKESENRSGQSADTQMLRYDIERIIDEISSLEQKVPVENAR
ncbi:MAG: hypothetical protein JXA71_18320, partial [Chitinispirillaceae bacterium]|nr:hypothetical protein [Chitinispirillaceae bacterium]